MFKIERHFNEVEGKIEFMVLKQDRFLFSMYGEPTNIWRKMKSFHSLPEARRYLDLARACEPVEVLFES